MEITPILITVLILLIPLIWAISHVYIAQKQTREKRNKRSREDLYGAKKKLEGAIVDHFVEVRRLAIEANVSNRSRPEYCRQVESVLMELIRKNLSDLSVDTAEALVQLCDIRKFFPYDPGYHTYENTGRYHHNYKRSRPTQEAPVDARSPEQVLLNVPAGASKKGLRAHWKKIRFDLHPDRGGNQERYVKLQNAYEKLMAQY